MQLDATFSSESDELVADVGAIHNSLDGRRARIFSVGRLFRRFDFRLEYDFAADAGLKDACLEGGKFIKYAKWRIGNFREPFSLSRQTGAHQMDGGAIEITGRYSTIDHNDGAVAGGEMGNLSLGLNWYLTQTTRFMVNYIHADVRDGGHADLALVRLQFNP